MRVLWLAVFVLIPFALPAQVVTVDRVLCLGPLPAPPAVFGAEAEGVELGVEGRRAAAGVEVSWLGQEYAWQVRERGESPFLFPAGGGERILFLAFYLDNPRWQELTFRVESSGAVEILVAGKRLVRAKKGRVEKGRHCGRGQWPVLLRLGAPAEGKWQASLTVTPGGVEKPLPPRIGLERAHRPARFGEVWTRKGVQGLVISPGGERLMFMAGEELQVRELPGGGIVHRIPLGPANPLAFLSSDEILYLQKKSLRRLDLRSGKGKTLCSGLDHAGNIRFTGDGGRVFWLEKNPKPKGQAVDRRTSLRSGMKDWNPEWRIWCTDAEGGLRRPITARGDFQVTSFALAPKGDKLVLVRKSPLPERPWFTTSLWEVDTSSLAARKLLDLRTGFESWPRELRLSPDGSQVLFIAPPAEIWPADHPKASREEEGKEAPPESAESFGEHNYHNADLYLYDLVGKKLRRLTAAFDPGVVAAGSPPWWGEGGRTIHFVAFAGRRKAFYTADLSGPEPTFAAWEAGPLVIGGITPAVGAGGGRVAFMGGGFTRFPYVCLLDREEARPREIHDPNEELLSRLRLVEPEDFRFLNKTGVRIDGWLYKPLDPPEGKLPLIVYYYGGATATPEACYWTHQYLCAQGYALYVVNPRGAGEYGRRFADSHVNDWGARATGDIIEGVERLLETHPELDRKRVGCWGGSYGGFTTMDLVSRTDLFAAAVSLYGISNLASYWGGGTWGWTYGDMAMARNFPWNNPEFFLRRSPLFRADKIRTPLLLLHGLADVNVPALESDQMFTALKVLGRTVEYVAFAGEDHGISGSRKSRTEHRVMMLEWFDRFLRDQPEAWRARWK